MAVTLAHYGNKNRFEFGYSVSRSAYNEIIIACCLRVPTPKIQCRNCQCPYLRTSSHQNRIRPTMVQPKSPIHPRASMLPSEWIGADLCRFAPVARLFHWLNTNKGQLVRSSYLENRAVCVSVRYKTGTHFVGKLPFSSWYHSGYFLSKWNAVAKFFLRDFPRFCGSCPIYRHVGQKPLMLLTLVDDVLRGSCSEDSMYGGWIRLPWMVDASHCLSFNGWVVVCAEHDK